MSIRERRERERQERERLIVDAARELAESEGWEAVTTRRLAERIEYSQPVLYSHFKGKDAIMAAVALDGFAELAAELRAARASAADPRAALAGAAAAYARFAETRPVVYEAMFTSKVDLTFASDETPPALQEGFAELREAVRPFAGDDDLGARTEVFWAGLHGLVTLTRGGRLPAEGHEERLALLIRRFTG
ncbi:helix-turn-helix transcriptional regulator [Actinoplanes sp. LDG1-06]|uniref:Helix-turn-helix transcriptional regulator n=1 Tax=Paractinoplanes ovalisporus TaxID=2810368 RepID=A0ABS2ANK1_9ACTN|nr:TetR/AcrR family transcriptional regulator [Actinoplanes ovalisporus]MBM2620811.1 helix-turn-helix transcriptional regulator [Actinoplanes ovalisporus]